MAVIFKIDGVEHEMLNGWSVAEVANGQNTFTCDVLSADASVRPTLNQEVSVVDGAVTRFGGYINNVVEVGVLGEGGVPITTRVTASDYNQLPLRRVVHETLPVGSLKDKLVKLAVYLQPYGVILSPTQVNGPQIPEQVIEDKHVTDVLNDLSTLSQGYIWTIDYNKVLSASLPANVPAPVNITAADVIGDVTVEPTQTRTANRVIVLAGTGTKVVSDAFIGNGLVDRFVLNYNFLQGVGYVTNNPPPFTPPDVNETMGDGTATWSYSDLLKSIVRNAGVIPANNRVGINYTAQFPLRVVADAGVVSADLIEDVFSYPEIFDRTVAQAMADGLLLQHSTPYRTIKYTTQQTGIHPGQTQTINIPRRNYNALSLITDVRIRQVEGSLIYSDVTAIEGVIYRGSWRDSMGSSSTGMTVGGVGVLIIGNGSVPSVGLGTANALALWKTTTTLGDSPITKVLDGVAVAGSVVSSGAMGARTFYGVLDVYGLELQNHLGLTVLSTPPDGSTNISIDGSLHSWGAIGARTFYGVLDVYGLELQNHLGQTVFSTPPGNSTDATLPGNLSIGQSLQIGQGRVTTAPTIDLRVAPSSNMVIDPGGKYALPNLPYDINLGSITHKFLTLHAAELWVETLVAQNTIATIGGRILVAPTNVLVADVAIADGFIVVKYNNLAVGDIIYLESNGSVEFMTVTGAPATSSPNWFAGTLSLLFAPASGTLGSGYQYAVTRNLDGSGANAWVAGAAVLNTGQIGSGFIDLYSIRGVKAATEAGPTIVGNIRLSSTYNDWAPRWAVGNLNGLYGYSATTYGAAFGDNAAAWVKIDPTNGVRIGHNATVFAQITAAGAATFTGSITITGGNAAKVDFTNVTAGYAASDAVGGAAKRVVGSSLAAPAGAGLYLGSDFLGYHNGTVWKTYMDNAGNFYLGGASGGSLSWNGSTLAITGVITSTSGTIGTFSIGATSLESGSVHLVGPGQICVGSMISGSDNCWISIVNGAPHRFWIGNVTASTVGFYINGDGSTFVNNNLTCVSLTCQGTINATALGSNTGTTLVSDASGYIRLNTSSEVYKTRIRRGWTPTSASDLLRIAPIQFDYIDGASDVIGFSAEELAALTSLPGLVNYNEKGLPESIREQAMLAYLLELARDLDRRLRVTETRP